MSIESVGSWILGWIKLPPKLIFSIFILSFSLLFLPDSWLVHFGVVSFATTNRFWVGLICLGSLAILISHFGLWIKDVFLNWIREKRNFKNLKKLLRNLTPEEKRVLAEFILLKTKSRYLDFQSGVVNGLVHTKIIYRAGNVGSLPGGFAYNMQPWSWDELHQNPDLLEPQLSELKAELEQINRRSY